MKHNCDVVILTPSNSKCEARDSLSPTIFNIITNGTIKTVKSRTDRDDYQSSS